MSGGKFGFIVPTLLVTLIVAPTGPANELLWQTNAGGDDIHVFDPESGGLVRRLVVGANPHGIATALTSGMVFVSLERNDRSSGLLLWIDKSTFEIEHRLEVGPEPHAIDVTPDGRWVYVPCRDGRYWVVDAHRRRVVAKIPTGGRPHNTTASPDGEFVYLSPMGAPKAVTVVAPKLGHRVVGEIRFSGSVRPPAIAPSRRWFFQHVDGLNGFEVADLGKHEVIERVEHGSNLGIAVWPTMLGFLGTSGFSRCHGLAVRPGEQEIWSVCGQYATIHSLDPGFSERARITLPGKGYWMTFSTDGGTAFIALSHESAVAVVDAEARELVRTLQAGNMPKRNLVITTPNEHDP